MNLNILKNNSKILSPQKEGDAGFDIVASSEPVVIGSVYQGLYYKSISHIEYETDIQIEPEKYDGEYKFFMLLFPRSSIYKTNLSLCNSVGVIDSGYRGSIKVLFKYNIQPEDMRIVEGKSFRGNKSNGIVSSIDGQKVYHKGDRIAQLIPMEHKYLNLNLVESLSESSRGKGGLGSTGS